MESKTAEASVDIVNRGTRIVESGCPPRCKEMRNWMLWRETVGLTG